MTRAQDDEGFTDEEAQRRFEAALRAALNTPPRPLKDRPPERPEPKGKGRKRITPPA
jgi:hypothetical protein